MYTPADIADTGQAGVERWRIPVYVPRVVLFAAAYLIAYGYGALFSQAAAAPLWFPDSVLLCALLLTPRREWWLYITVGLAIRLFTPLPVPTWFVLVTSLNDMFKSILAAYLLLRVGRGSVRLESFRNFVLYLPIAVFLAPALSAFAGAAARSALGYAFWPAWNQWFLGDALANLVFTPTLLYWHSGRFRTFRKRIPEILLWAIGFSTSLFCVVSFAHSTYAPIALYAPVPFLIWAAARFGPVGASTALSLIALFSMFHAYAPLGLTSENVSAHDVLLVQLFLAVMTVPMLFVAILIEERDAVEAGLRDSRERLNENYERVRDLAGKLIDAQEAERKRIALDLHDDIGQRLSLLAVQLDRLKQDRAALASELQIGEVHEQVVDLASDIQALSRSLHTPKLEYLGLAAAANGFCRELSDRLGVEIDFRSEETPKELPREISLCLFRVLQEALQNATKHSGSRQFQVSLNGGANEIELTVHDSGIGFEPEDAIKGRGLGLTSMQERLKLVDGQLSIDSKPQCGTKIQARVPLSPKSAGANG